MVEFSFKFPSSTFTDGETEVQGNIPFIFYMCIHISFFDDHLEKIRLCLINFGYMKEDTLGFVENLACLNNSVPVGSGDGVFALPCCFKNSYRWSVN